MARKKGKKVSKRLRRQANQTRGGRIKRDGTKEKLREGDLVKLGRQHLSLGGSDIEQKPGRVMKKRLSCLRTTKAFKMAPWAYHRYLVKTVSNLRKPGVCLRERREG